MMFAIFRNVHAVHFSSASSICCDLDLGFPALFASHRFDCHQLLGQVFDMTGLLFMLSQLKYVFRPGRNCAPAAGLPIMKILQE